MPYPFLYPFHDKSSLSALLFWVTCKKRVTHHTTASTKVFTGSSSTMKNQGKGRKLRILTSRSWILKQMTLPGTFCTMDQSLLRSLGSCASPCILAQVRGRSQDNPTPKFDNCGPRPPIQKMLLSSREHAAPKCLINKASSLQSSPTPSSSLMPLFTRPPPLQPHPPSWSGQLQQKPPGIKPVGDASNPDTCQDSGLGGQPAPPSCSD